MAGQLGLRPTDKTRPVLRMGAHLRAAAFQAPASIDYAVKIDRWIVGANDRFGTCGPVSVANFALLVSTVLGNAPFRATDDEVFDLYRRSGNPNFDGQTRNPDGSYVDDNGVDMTVMLSELVKGGIGEGSRNVKALAFGRLDAYSTAEMWAAAAVFGGGLIGADLDRAQGDQFDAGTPWDYASGSPDWGGHAMLAASRYTDAAGTLADRTSLVTWGQLTDCTDAFICRQVPEVYAVIWPWHLKDAGFLAGVDMAGVAAEFEVLTGRPFPAQVPVSPAPNAAVDALSDFPWPNVEPWRTSPHIWRRATAAAKALTDWKAQHRL